MRALLLLTLLAAAAAAERGRYEEFCERVRDGFSPTLATEAATWFGGAGEERFVGGGFQADGVVAVGSCAFGALPGGPEPVRWGADDAEATSLPRPAPARPGKRVAAAALTDPRSRASAGFVVRCDATGATVLAVARFGTGVASIASGVVADDGGIIVAGGCTAAALRAAAGGARVLVTGESVGAEDAARHPDAYLARIAADGRSLEWVAIVLGAGGHLGQVQAHPEGWFADLGRPAVVAADGSGVRTLALAGGGRTSTLAVDPRSGRLLRGGDRNTHTGREPWRCPWLEVLTPEGAPIATLWNWDAQRVGGEGCRLVADSSARLSRFLPDGAILCAGWSDGGNSVFLRQPTDLDAVHDAFARGFCASAWGMGVGGAGWLMRIDPGDWTVRGGTLWLAFVPMDRATFAKQAGRPNTVGIDSLALLDDGSLAVAGSAATGLIDTPDAWYRYPGSGRYGGATVTVFTPDLARLRFSSYLPGCESAQVVARGQRLLVLAASRPDDGDAARPTRPPLAHPAQAAHGGGWDAHLVMMRATAFAP